MFDHAIKLGILQGGQLGRMLIQSCLNYGIETYVMDKDPDAPCRHCATHFQLGDVSSAEDVYNFGKQVDLLTFEFEHVNIDALKQLRAQGLTIYPDPTIIELIQDKGKQKQFYLKHGFPTAKFVLLNHKEEINAHLDRLPLVQKSRQAGYDGKGVYMIKKASDVSQVIEGPCVLEECVSFVKEIAVIVARNHHGQVVSYPVVDMEFEKEAHLLSYLSAPADISDLLADEARSLAENIAVTLDCVGLLAVELFVTQEGKLLVNEVAPRPHNSGHHTIEANITSQYDQHLRAILGLPLGSTELRGPSVMINLLGAPDFEGNARYEGIQEALKKDGVSIHLYGKTKTRPYRKMGHATVIADTIEEAKESALWVKDNVKIIA